MPIHFAKWCYQLMPQEWCGALFPRTFHARQRLTLSDCRFCSCGRWNTVSHGSFSFHGTLFYFVFNKCLRRFWGTARFVVLLMWTPLLHLTPIPPPLGLSLGPNSQPPEVVLAVHAFFIIVGFLFDNYWILTMVQWDQERETSISCSETLWSQTS